MLRKNYNLINKSADNKKKKKSCQEGETLTLIDMLTSKLLLNASAIPEQKTEVRRRNKFVQKEKNVWSKHLVIQIFKKNK